MDIQIDAIDFRFAELGFYKLLVLDYINQTGEKIFRDVKTWIKRDDAGELEVLCQVEPTGEYMVIDMSKELKYEGVHFVGVLDETIKYILTVGMNGKPINLN